MALSDLFKKKRQFWDERPGDTTDIKKTLDDSPVFDPVVRSARAVGRAVEASRGKDTPALRRAIDAAKRAKAGGRTNYVTK